MTMNIDWASALVPIIVQIGFLVFFLGKVRSQIDSLGARIEKLELDTAKEHDSTARVGDRIHELALGAVRSETLLEEIKIRVDSLCLEAAECPLAQGTLIPRRKRKASHAEEGTA